MAKAIADVNRKLAKDWASFYAGLALPVPLLVIRGGTPALSIDNALSSFQPSARGESHAAVVADGAPCRTEDVQHPVGGCCSRGCSS